MSVMNYKCGPWCACPMCLETYPEIKRKAKRREQQEVRKFIQEELEEMELDEDE